jgi:hypothetical protein
VRAVLLAHDVGLLPDALRARGVTAVHVDPRDVPWRVGFSQRDRGSDHAAWFEVDGARVPLDDAAIWLADADVAAHLPDGLPPEVHAAAAAPPESSAPSAKALVVASSQPGEAERCAGAGAAPSLAVRRVNMRLWRLFEAAGREPCIWAHMTVCYEVPLFSFCRYLSNGEFVTGVEPYGKRDAMDFWKPETLRLLGPAAKWGAGVSFLTTLPRALPPGPAAEQWAYPQVRAEDALYATSGIQTLSNGLTQKLVETKIYDRPPRVFPWWDADTVVKLSKPKKANVL